MARELRAWRHLKRPAVLPCDRCGRREEVTLQPDGRQLCWYCMCRLEEIAEADREMAARRRRHEMATRYAERELRHEPDEAEDWPADLWPVLRVGIIMLLILTFLSQIAIHYGWL